MNFGEKKKDTFERRFKMIKESKLFNNKKNKRKFINILNKNELVVLVVALMLVTAGYMDYLGKVKTNEVDNQNMEEELTTITKEEEVADIGDATLVSAEIEYENTNEEESVNIPNDDSYFISSKLERAKIYSQTIENYQKIMENSSISEEQKAIASQEINKINQLQNTIMICENLLLAKGFEKCVIFVNDKSISVIIGKDELKQDELAQIQNIISRELNSEIENIHISTK